MIFNQAQAEFLKNEFGLDVRPGESVHIPKDQWDKLIDDFLMIECDEAMKEPFSDRGRVAVSLIDMPYSM